MKKRKLAAPIVISVLVGLWLLGYAVLIFLVPAIPLWIKLLGAVIPLALLGVTIYVLCERIKEIRSGEEDDLDNY
ncbi:MAG: hypothetical protein KH459_04680 [Oscillospiraceae bacterium]|jgi:hypothetical protein|uniref:Uncharacterized protein n=1 Tax=Intestinimonas massiliensis (ex Afouda et al. 2020) TaxID=1673721 RepID=A0AAW5JPI7_9FIRM|nr:MULTISPECIES: hypothetical protein [Intestinimonas]MBS6282319.1 hypothetical protein [Oscillospiraceae bacterium]MCI5561882.1 hypothetical protein [Intestinimonas massiliensis (ex Afouda et al. 2020)]MCQ4770760.1 hypothetical protein [Intestinimonas massiliensis (ex Afouda et al. 2020)]MCQ4807550.1 hypothetical protein [Intestinimonas massiliensis (ex Afouda et al. 2020)]MDY5340182.1 hypothetical protein [Intestinimonas sp.]